MNSKKDLIVITGATGKIGTVVSAALKNDYPVVALNRDCSDSEFECLTMDITSDKKTERALSELRERHGNRIAAVIHLAGYFDFSGEPNPLYDQVNVEGIRRLLRALQAFEVERFIYSSSMLVHEPTGPGIPLVEGGTNWGKMGLPLIQSRHRADHPRRTWIHPLCYFTYCRSLYGLWRSADAGAPYQANLRTLFKGLSVCRRCGAGSVLYSPCRSG